MGMKDLLSNKRVILVLFLGAAIVDFSGLLYSVMTKNTILLGLYIIIAPPLLLVLLWWWNIDERTNQALRNASRDTIFIFLVILFVLGISLFIYDVLHDFKYWTTTSVVLILGFLLLFLQAIMSVVYELRMQ